MLVTDSILGGLVVLSPDASLCTRWRASDAGWGVCLDELQAGCVAYTAAAGDAEGFAAAMSAHGCAVHALGANATGAAAGGPCASAACRAGEPRGWPHECHTPWLWTAAEVRPPFWHRWTLEALLRALGHGHVDVLRAGLDGGDWELLEHLLSDPGSMELLAAGRLARQLSLRLCPAPPRGAEAWAPDPAALDARAADLLGLLQVAGFLLWRHSAADGAPEAPLGHGVGGLGAIAGVAAAGRRRPRGAGRAAGRGTPQGGAERQPRRSAAAGCRVLARAHGALPGVRGHVRRPAGRAGGAPALLR
ncbi:unnamed protein product [Prorocentrum cordatum]|uniref:Uncharacterized protein n=1 Tax=Prorocentrum cordatum TaxID=2364126 RepID=A0ABN9PNH4_9DINO|nr:unnamed protein product [Polarella glacialis]